MGPCPPGLTLDRKDNNKGYNPKNCRWAARRQQNRNTRANRRVLFRGRRLLISDLAREYCVPLPRVLARLKRGWSPEDAVTVPAGARHTNARLLTLNGETHCIADWARKVGINCATLSRRLATGSPLRQALTSPISQKRKSRILLFRGREQTLQDWARQLKIPPQRISQRLNQLHWSVEEALTTPVGAPRKTTHWVVLDGQRMGITAAATRLGVSAAFIRYRAVHGIPLRKSKQPRRKYRYQGQLLTIGQWAKKLRIPVSTLHDRLRRGWTVRETLTGCRA